MDKPYYPGSGKDGSLAGLPCGERFAAFVVLTESFDGLYNIGKSTFSSTRRKQLAGSRIGCSVTAKFKHIGLYF